MKKRLSHKSKSSGDNWFLGLFFFSPSCELVVLSSFFSKAMAWVQKKLETDHGHRPLISGAL